MRKPKVTAFEGWCTYSSAMARAFDGWCRNSWTFCPGPLGDGGRVISRDITDGRTVM